MIKDSSKDCNNCQFIKQWIKAGFPLEDLAEEVVFVIPGSSKNHVFGKFCGLEEVKEFFKLLQKKLIEKNLSQQIKITDCLAQANRVIVLLEESFIRENEIAYLSSGAWLFELNDQAKIVYLYCYDNTLITSEALE